MELEIHGTKKYSNSHPKQIKIKFFSTFVDWEAVARLKFLFHSLACGKFVQGKNDKKYFLGKTKNDKLNVQDNSLTASANRDQNVWK